MFQKNERRKIKIIQKTSKRISLHYKTLTFTNKINVVETWVPAADLLPHDLEIEIIKNLVADGNTILTTVSPRSLFDGEIPDDIEIGRVEIEEYLKKDNLAYEASVVTKQYLFTGVKKYPLFILEVPIERLEYLPLHSHLFTYFIAKKENIDKLKCIVREIFADVNLFKEKIGELIENAEYIYHFSFDVKPFFGTKVNKKIQLIEKIKDSCKKLNVLYKSSLFSF